MSVMLIMLGLYDYIYIYIYIYILHYIHFITVCEHNSYWFNTSKTVT